MHIIKRSRVERVELWSQVDTIFTILTRTDNCRSCAKGIVLYLSYTYILGMATIFQEEIDWENGEKMTGLSSNKDVGESKSSVKINI